MVQISSSERLLQIPHSRTCAFIVESILTKSWVYSSGCWSKCKARRSALLRPIPGKEENASTAFSRCFEEKFMLCEGTSNDVSIFGNSLEMNELKIKLFDVVVR